MSAAARARKPGFSARTQSSLAVSADGRQWVLLNCSPDLRQQIIATPQLHPKAGQLRHTPIAGVILTNGEVDAVADQSYAAIYRDHPFLEPADQALRLRQILERPDVRTTLHLN